MSGQNLSNIHDYATELQNTTGLMDPVLAFQPDNGLMLEILNRAVRGDAPGIPLYFKPRDSNGDLLPLDTEVAFQYERPSDKQATTVSDEIDNIQQYHNLSIKDQQDTEYVDAVKIPLDGKALRVRDIDKFYLSLKSSAQIDWSNSEAYIEGSVVNQSPM